jgi:ABC-type transport system involved in multi-copper enzyme maturation permease subunit
MTVKGTAKTHRLWATEPGLFFGAFSTEEFALPLALVLYGLAANVIGFGSWIAVLLGVVITAFFIPNMLRKGTVDLLLAKPISRPTLICYKYLGGLTFIFFSTIYAIGGIWLALGIRSGLWANGTLLLIFTITFFFAILYAVSTLVAVVTRSVVASILVTILAWFVFFVIGQAYNFVDEYQRRQEQREKVNPMMNDPARGEESEWVRWIMTGIRVVHAVSPRTEDLNRLNNLIVQTDFLSGNLGDMSKFDTSKRNWWDCLLVSTAWIFIFLGLSCVWFYFKDY